MTMNTAQSTTTQKSQSTASRPAAQMSVLESILETVRARRAERAAYNTMRRELSKGVSPAERDELFAIMARSTAKENAGLRSVLDRQRAA